LYAVQVLARHGYRVAELQSDHVDPDFTEEIDAMASEEHGRWNVERLRAKWRYADVRDRERMLSPYLTAWSQLPENIKDYDRTAVRNYARVLRAAKLGIYKIGGP